jgi:tRNA1(Val) A37 N6-methylase TrmN6
MLIDYSQPDFYRFSEDSTKLVTFIQKHLKNSPRSIIDMGAGSGVIGIELKKLFPQAQLTLVEIQSEFLPYLKANIELFQIQANIVHSSFADFKTTSKFDLIVSNPPYFSKGEGRVSPDTHKQICRTWEQDSLEILLQKGLECLEREGEMWLSLRSTPKVLELLQKYHAKVYVQPSDLIYTCVLA